ncbi:hypothetical protein BV22DRAFT_1045306 [Leucogyrophana mollusca]|uniref:Uncharacterized protein n=1 Tax=Leucogyrophana mollusca TaxID=85980 RepID=A0ACB8BNM8_9AGAM|nr:hypothetical protein BV22DRAFT_1045306 [Leucogyrophana mollusca]
MSGSFAFPAPVGGVPLPSDFGPSVFFAVLYATLIPVCIYRFMDRRSRALLAVSSTMTSIERIVVFSLRAIQSHNEARRVSKGLTTYMQATIGVAYIGIATDVVVLARCLLVESTRGPTPPDSPGAPSTSSLHPTTPPSSTFHLVDGTVMVDQPRKRFQYRRFTDIWKLVFLAATIPGIIGNVDFSKGMNDQSAADKVMSMRYASSAIALTLFICSAGVLIWAVRTIPSVKRGKVAYLLAILACTSSTAIYRLAVMYNKTTSLTSTAPGSGNTIPEKVEFYIFHIVSDWMACALLVVPNVRQWFNTGPLGDWRAVDPTEQEIRWARERELAKAQKKSGVAQAV